MLNSVVTHWKTTLAGLVAAAAHVTVNGMTIKQFVLGFTLAAIGALAKDGNKQ